MCDVSGGHHASSAFELSARAAIFEASPIIIHAPAPSCALAIAHPTGLKSILWRELLFFLKSLSTPTRAHVRSTLYPSRPLSVSVSLSLSLSLSPYRSLSVSLYVSAALDEARGFLQGEQGLCNVGTLRRGERKRRIGSPSPLPISSPPPFSLPLFNLEHPGGVRRPGLRAGREIFPAIIS